MHPPDWLETVAWVSLVVAVCCAVVVAADILSGRRQDNWIMDVVWAITPLWASVFGLYAYFSVGRAARDDAASDGGDDEKAFWQQVGTGVFHCGSGCTLGDLTAEWFTFFVPVYLLGHHIFGSWVVDFTAAFLFGIAFQYFTIAPMRDLGVWNGLKAAVKADTLSLTSWQVGMYGWMAVTLFVIFSPELEKTNPVFWFMMQIAMVCGFVTAYPVNWWLIRSGVKEAM